MHADVIAEQVFVVPTAGVSITKRKHGLIILHYVYNV